MTAAGPASYDALPYPSMPKEWSHPDRLATLARLYGMDPPPVDRCRVLELGCADGGNLLPMAVALPHSRFVGIDYAPGQVEAGQAVVDALGLRNISLAAIDVRALGDDLGEFDYIIAYGIYSWVPPEVQDAILRVCRQHLAPNGVAFVSYNTYPGWHVRAMVREMLLYHVREIEDVRERVRRARDFLDFLVDSGPSLRQRFSRGLFAGAAGPILERERDLLRSRSDSYLAHELLEDVNAPLYFHEFVARAAPHGLQYLAEAEFAMMQFGNLPQPVSEGLRQISGTRVEAEQYMDFLCNRTFRQTLLCHADVALTPTPDAITQLALASPVEPVGPDPAEAETGADEPRLAERFRGPSGSAVRIRHPLSAGALLELHDCWPQALPFWELLRRARVRLDGFRPPSGDAPGSLSESSPDDPDALRVAQQLLHCYGVDLVEAHSYVPAFTTEIGVRPVACPLARYQAQRGPVVANRRHEVVTLAGGVPGVARAVLPLLDGSRDRTTLRAALAHMAAGGALDIGDIDAGGMSPSDVLSGVLDEALLVLARSALLVDENRQ